MVEELRTFGILGGPGTCLSYSPAEAQDRAASVVEQAMKKANPILFEFPKHKKNTPRNGVLRVVELRMSGGGVGRTGSKK